MSDGPTLDFREQAAETREDLWRLRQGTPERPIGSDDTYHPPSRFWLPKVAEAYALLCGAEEQAKAEVPERLLAETKRLVRQRGPDWSDMAEKEPELRRYFQIIIARDLVESLFDDLANEGRPQPLPDLRLGKVRRETR